jgi:UDP-2,3-diacylglucosamine hydrolase
MHGNRDFLISEKFLTDTGIKLLPDPFEITMHNKKVLLSHGDFLCTDDVDYINFRNQVRDKAWQDNFLSKSIEERSEIASKLRSDSNDATQDKSIEITDVNESSVKKIIGDYSPDIFIHGHTHRPNIHEYASSKRIVLGDWDDFGWYLRLDDESYNLEKFSIA